MATANKRIVKKARAEPAKREFNFVWEGKDKAGRIVRGEMRAGGPSMVQAMLRRQGVFVTRVRKKPTKGAARVTDADITLFTRQLATMMRSGVPLLQSFDIVSKGATKASVSQLIQSIKTDVETGSSLNQAFRKHPQHFDELFCNLVQAGEQGGILESLLDRLATYKEKIQAIKGKIKSAMFYPAAILVVAFIVTAIIMIFVIPQFKSVFSSFGSELPALTLMVIAMSEFFVAYWWLMLFIIVGGIVGFFYAWKRSKPMQIAMDKFFLKIPVIGDLIRKATIARWTRTLSTMFAAGVPLVEALDSVGGASGNYVYTAATKQIQRDISTGNSLTVAMQNSLAFPAMVLQMVAIGEESGQLDSMLSKVADFFEREVDEAVESLSSLMEPMIMAFLGVLIGGIVVAMYLPIFKLGSIAG